MTLTNRQKLEIIKEMACRNARNDFLAFRKLLNQKSKWGWWQEEVAHELQQFERDFIAGKRPKLIIQAPPQHGKSVQVIDFIAYLSGKYPDNRTIYTSFSDRLGTRANLRLQRIFKSEMFQLIFPDFRIDWGPKSGYSANQELIEYIERDGYFRNTTVGGAITGESLDLGVIDDPIKGRKDASSELVRDNAWQWFTDDFFSRFADDAGLLIILTRWHVDDPVGRLIERDASGRIKVLRYPAIAEHDEPHRKAGDPLFPEHKPLDFLLERKELMSAGNWEALYQQNPTVADGELFKPDRLRVVDAIPHGVTKWCRGWDLAASGNGDYTAGVKVGRYPDGQFIVVDVVAAQAETSDRDALLVNTATADGYYVTQSVPQDPGQAGKSLAAYIVRALSGYVVHTSTESGDKTSRADPVASQINVGNVMMLRGAWNSAFVDELRGFPFAKHDDRVDALSRAFNYLCDNRIINYEDLM